MQARLLEQKRSKLQREDSRHLVSSKALHNIRLQVQNHVPKRGVLQGTSRITIRTARYRLWAGTTVLPTQPVVLTYHCAACAGNKVRELDNSWWIAVERSIKQRNFHIPTIS